MWQKMDMFVVHLSGSSQKANHCQEMHLESYRLHGDWEQGKGTVTTSKDLQSLVRKGTLILLKQPLSWK